MGVCELVFVVFCRALFLLFLDGVMLYIVLICIVLVEVLLLRFLDCLIVVVSCLFVV